MVKHTQKNVWRLKGECPRLISTGFALTGIHYQGALHHVGHMG